MRTLLPAILLATLTLAACAHQAPSKPDTPPPAAAAVTPVNKVCPMTGEVLDPSVIITFKGQPVGFCCSECVDDWNHLTEDQRAAKLKKSM